jgi:hypothetical protein
MVRFIIPSAFLLSFMVLSFFSPLLSIHIKYNLVDRFFFQQEVFKEKLGFYILNSGAVPISPKRQSNLFILHTRAFSCINFAIHHLTLFVINIS